MKEDDPSNFKYLMSWGQSLEVSDVSIEIYRNEKRNRNEMIFCHKSMNINTVNVFMLDLSKEKCPILTRHESFQMWESKIYGFLIHNNTDFMTLSY
jgi:hypothetical protein